MGSVRRPWSERTATRKMRRLLGALGMLFAMFDFHAGETAAFIGGSGARLPALYRDLHRGVWPRPRKVRKQLLAAGRQFELGGPVERLQRPGPRLLGRRSELLSGTAKRVYRLA